MIKEGAAVIDVGINRVQDPVTGKNRLVGDVDFEGKPGLNTIAFLTRTSLASHVSVRSHLFLSIFRCETEGGLHHPCTWRCGTNDCGNAYEKHCQGS